MLDVNKIAAFDTSLTDQEWLKMRIGKFSASEAGKLISAKSHLGVFSKGAISYIQGKAAEHLTGKPAKEEFHNQNTDHGNATEDEAIRYFCTKMDMQALRNTERGDTRMMIIQDEYSSATPDALIATTSLDHIYDESKTKLKVDPLEIKCPPVPHRFIKLVTCRTPADLKATEPLYYWQLLTQMIFCDSLRGFFACYNPTFPNPMGIIVFNKIDLTEDVIKMNQTLKFAKKEMHKFITQLA